jgi:hypothetical protein
MILKKFKIHLGKKNEIEKLEAIIIEQAEIIKILTKALKEMDKLKSENQMLRKENEELRKKLGLNPESPSCPSGAKPSFIKPNSKKKGKNPGREKGHKGVTRKMPLKDEITDRVEHQEDECPNCGNKFKNEKPSSKRTRIIIDIKMPEELKNTEHTIYGHWCANCKVMIEPAITDALPGFNIGLLTYVFSALKHYHFGMSISKISKELAILGMSLTNGALAKGWQALADYLKPFYNEIHDIIKNTTEALHGDETGHRQNGKKFWLWVFTTKLEAFFAIREKRNGNVVKEILDKEFLGILITDFWKPYLAVKARFRQWCVAHFLREFKKIEFANNNSPPEYLAFKKKVKRLFRDALSFSKKGKITKKDRKRAQKRFLKRLDNIVESYIDSNIKDINRLTKRLKKYRDGFFTFISIKGVDATNNHAERIIRYAVIMRKISFHTMSDAGSETMAILMTVFKTLELRGIDPFKGTLEIVKNEIKNRHFQKNRLAA